MTIPQPIPVIKDRMIYSNFSGLWQADLGKSRIAGSTPSKILMKIAHGNEVLRQAVLTTLESGEEHRLAASFSMTAPQSTTELNGVPITSRVRWNGRELVIELTYSGKLFRDYWSLSDDEQVLTMEHRDDAIAGQITVLERLA